MKPWLIPFYDSFVELNGGGSVGGGLTHNDFLKKVFIETVPFAFMRGRTFHDSFILCDEMQNSTPEQMLMLLTRIGKCSKMVITGDLKQSDLNCYNNGLRDFVDKLFFMKNKILALKKNCGGGDEVGADTMTFTIKNVAFIRLSQDDIKRCDTVNFILDIYKYAR
jgi:predicted ribonuclease YlaK